MNANARRIIKKLKDDYLADYVHALENDYYEDILVNTSALSVCHKVLELQDGWEEYLNETLAKHYDKGDLHIRENDVYTSYGIVNASLNILKIIEGERNKHYMKYYLRLPNAFDDNSYLNYHRVAKEYIFDDYFEYDYFKTSFTQEEIDKLPNQDFIQTLIKEEV